MNQIIPIFNEQAQQKHSSYDGAHADQSTAGDGGDLTLERHGSDFQEFINKIDVYLRSGLKEDIRLAFEMTRQAWQNTDFGHKTEVTLTDKLEEITEKLHTDHTISGSFLQSALHLQKDTMPNQTLNADLNNHTVQTPSRLPAISPRMFGAFS